MGVTRRSMLVGFAAAAGAPFVGVPGATAATAMAAVTAWVPAAADKIRRDRAFPGSPPLRLTLHGARGERQYGQIVVRAGGSTTVTATASDLTGPAGTVPASTVRFFQQRYIQVTTTQNARFPAGWYPDAVVPGASVPAGPDANSALMVTVTPPAALPAGTYTGTITLAGGGTPVSVPISLTSWGFLLPVTPSAATAFGIWYQQAAVAEGVRWGTPEYQQRMDAYYAYQRDHRAVSIMAPLIGDPGPGPNYSPGPGPDPEPDDFIAKAAAYLSDKRVSAFQVPAYASGSQDTGITIDTAKLGRVVGWLRQAGLIGKSYFYVGDEPGSAQAEDNLMRAYAKLHEVAPEVPAILTLTHPPRQSLLDVHRAWCFEQHTVPMLDEPRAVDTLTERGDLVWWYVCIGDTWPLPGLMIDDSLLGSRLLPWMQHALGYSGLLYWSTTAFGSWDGTAYKPRDVYASPYSANLSAGDGFLLYPGKPAGVPGPIGSLRLHALEGGLQDREMLAMFEKRGMEIAGQLGVADRIAVRDLLKPYFDVLYRWIDSYRDDPGLFDSIRTEIGLQLDRMLHGEPAVVVVGAARAYHVPVTVYVRSGVRVTISGAVSTPAERTPKADVHKALLPLPAGHQKITVTAGPDTLTRSVQVGPVGLPHLLRINSFETDRDAARLRTNGTVTERSTAHPSTGASCLKITFPPGSEFPGVFFYAADIGRGDWSRYDTFAFEAYNDSDQVLVLNGKFHNPVRADDNHHIYLAPRKRQTVRFRLWHVPADIYHPDQGQFDLSTLTSFLLYAYKRDTAVSVYVDSLRFESTNTVLESPGTAMRLDDAGVLTYALTAADGSVAYGRRPSGTTWQLETVPGPVAGPVASMLDVSGRMHLLGRNPAGELVWQRRDPDGWRRLGGPSVALAGPPAAAIDAAGRLTFLARAPQGTLVVGWLESPVSTGWRTATLTDLGNGTAPTVTGDPAVGMDVSGKLCFFARTQGDQLLHGWQDTAGGPGWRTDLIGQDGTGEAVRIAGRPAVSQGSSGRLCFVARDPAGRIAHGWQSAPGSGPWRWATLPPVTDTDDDGNHVTVTVAGDPASALDACARLTYFVRTSDGRVLHGWQDSPDNGPWHASLIRDTAGTYATLTGDPVVGQDETGRLVFTAAASGRTVTGWQDRPGTGPWMAPRFIKAFRRLPK